MESLSDAETVHLCRGCRLLQLDSVLVSHNPDSSHFPTPTFITLSTDKCSLCSLISQYIRKLRLNIYIKDQNSLRVDASPTGEKKIDTRNNGTVRRFEVAPASAPRVKIVRLWPCVYPIPSARAAAHGNQNQDISFPSGRLIDPLVEIRLCKLWMELCSKHHGDKCARPPWIALNDDLPSTFRLIDVQAGCVIDAPVKPVYFALSYVWGPPRNDLYATSTNITGLKEKHSFERQALPQTILDAMKLVSELGGRYLWVDRLCILQDDEGDKALQIPCMDSIYSLAELVIIAASGSGAHDGVAGLSVPRTVEQNVCRIGDKMALMTIPTENRFSSYTYSQRGWTFQERLLARRSLMFTEGQAYWSCSCADWTERLCLEPSTSDVETSSLWTIPRNHLGSYEVVTGDFYRDFSRQQYNNLPRFYALKDFTNESDTLDAISGLLRRITLVTGDEFHWGHILSSFFDQSLSWRKGRLDLERRTALCPIRGRGATCEVPFPSWSWLAWKTAIKFVLSLQLNAFPNIRLIPEIEFFALDVDGRTKRLVAPVSESGSGFADHSLLLNNKNISGSWKGKEKVIADDFLKEKVFMDSGRLLFWTSHAELSLQAEDRVRQGCVYLKIISASGETLGSVSELTLDSDRGSAWPFVKFDEQALQSFIVISRKYDIEKREGEQVLVAQPILKVMWIHWENEERKVASRISVGEVNEMAWVNVKRDWRLIVLK